MSLPAGGDAATKAKKTFHLTALVKKDHQIKHSNQEMVVLSLQDDSGKTVGRVDFPQCGFSGSYICSTNNGGGISVDHVGSGLRAFVNYPVFQDGSAGFGHGDLIEHQQTVGSITLKNKAVFKKGRRFPAVVKKN